MLSVMVMARVSISVRGLFQRDLVCSRGVFKFLSCWKRF